MFQQRGLTQTNHADYCPTRNLIRQEIWYVLQCWNRGLKLRYMCITTTLCTRLPLFLPWLNPLSRGYYAHAWNIFHCSQSFIKLQPISVTFICTYSYSVYTEGVLNDRCVIFHGLSNCEMNTFDSKCVRLFTVRIQLCCVYIMTEEAVTHGNEMALLWATNL